jgi:hypothetical protein
MTLISTRVRRNLPRMNADNGGSEKTKSQGFTTD